MKKGEGAKRLGLLIGCGSQCSSLPMPIRKKRYNSERKRGQGEDGGSGEFEGN